jgi:hypothetical protein
MRVYGGAHQERAPVNPVRLLVKLLLRVDAAVDADELGVGEEDAVDDPR